MGNKGEGGYIEMDRKASKLGQEVFAIELAPVSHHWFLIGAIDSREQKQSQTRTRDVVIRMQKVMATNSANGRLLSEATPPYQTDSSDENPCDDLYEHHQSAA